jgi:hypothetical protein
MMPETSQQFRLQPGRHKEDSICWIRVTLAIDVDGSVADDLGQAVGLIHS